METGDRRQSYKGHDENLDALCSISFLGVGGWTRKNPS